MKIKTEELKRCLRINQGTIGNKLIPAFNNLKISNVGVDVSIISSDGITQSRTKMVLEELPKDDHNFQVSSGSFINMVNLSDEEYLEFKVNEKSLVITAGRNKYKQAISSGKDYPMKQSLASGEENNAPGELSNMIEKSLRFFNPNDIRHMLRGMLIRKSKDGENIQVLATNGSFGIIMSVPFMGEIEDTVLDGSIGKAIGVFNTSPAVTIASTKNSFSISDSTCEIIGTKLEGNFPNIDAAINPDKELYCIVNRAEIIKSLKRTAIYSGSDNDGARVVKIEENKEDGSLIISSQDKETNKQARETIDVIFSGGDKEAIHFNPKFLLTAIEAIERDNIRLMWTIKQKGMFITPEEEMETIAFVSPVSVPNQ
jgi:DNA polymerase-3 subunit beta